jgi:phage/plasmid-associated DNA primase
LHERRRLAGEGILWWGKKRGGKDTTKNALESLLPADSVIGPTLDSMGTNFGMSAFIYKQLAIVGDMRLGQKCDQDLLAENILKLTGRGIFTMDRKYQSAWTGRLPCKLLLISNQPPRIKDTSGMVASRLISFQTRASFFGREDPNYFPDKLRPELPGIALWALDGLQRVIANKKIAEPKFVHRGAWSDGACRLSGVVLHSRAIGTRPEGRDDQGRAVRGIRRMGEREQPSAVGPEHLPR